MVFSIVIGALFLAVVFFHYLQGFFSSTLSAILAVLSAVLAFSLHETVVEKLLQGKAANVAHSMVLVVLFAVIYTLLRFMFDKFVPGGIRLPVLVDRVGGAVMGVVAATFALGILAIAAEELPVGPSIWGYTKYATEDTDAQVTSLGSGRNQDGKNFDELHSTQAGSFTETDRKNLFPWVTPGLDEIVVGAVSHLSGSGSLRGDQPLDAVHPDFLQETFAQRIGVQAGAQHVTMNLPGAAEQAVMLNGVYTLPQVRAEDGEISTIRRASPNCRCRK